MSITKTITVKLPPLPAGYELCERGQLGTMLDGIKIYYPNPSTKWVDVNVVQWPYFKSDLAIFARPITPKMRRMTMTELESLVPAGLYFKFSEGTNDWHLVMSRATVLNILGAKDSVISTDSMKTWRKPEVEETE
jgi:hypothetical protein